MPLADEHYRAPLLWLLAPYLGGLVIASGGAGAGGALPIGIALLLAGAAVMVSFARGRPASVIWMVLLAGAAGLGGIVRMHQALDPGGANARWSGMPEREARLEIELTRLFAAADPQTRQLCIGRIVGAPEPLGDLQGDRVCLALAGKDVAPNMLVITARLEVHGILRRIDPLTTESGSFADFLLTSGVRFMLERATVPGVTHAPGPLAVFLQRVSTRFDAILRHGLPEGHAATAVYVAMFLGRKSELTDTQKENYLRSGTMHLFAISGLHIVVIAACLHGLLAVARVSPRIAATIGLLALWIFVEATGGTPSARRAFLMVAFVWAGTALRRPVNPLAALVASALVVLVRDPLALLSASFQLSYAVVAALLLYGLPLRNRWQARWQPWRDIPEADWGWWRHDLFRRGRNTMALAAISCSATLISTPLSIAYFHLASPGAVLSNLALVPITSGAIAAGFASLLCGLLGATWLSTVFNHAGALILAVVDTGAGWAAGIPGMFFPASFSAGWMAPTIVLVLLALLVTGYARGWNRLPGQWWTPPIVLIAMIVFLVTPGSAGRESAPMKSAYELAMERLKKSDPAAGPELSAEEKARLAEIDRVFQGRIAEREIFLNQRLAEARAGGQAEEMEKIRQQMVSERARLEEDREAEKNKIRRAAGGSR
jgi:competence protein ComEC